MWKLSKNLGWLFAFHTSFLNAINPAGTNADTLESAIIAANNGSFSTVDFDNDVILVLETDPNVSAQVRPFFTNGDFTFQAGADITVQGNNYSLNGRGTNVRGFFFGANGVPAPPPFSRSATIIDLHFVNCLAKGGDGGGGGLGAGGGIFVGTNTNVILRDCTFSGCQAIGGNGIGNNSGGGMRGNGKIGGGGGGFGGDGASVSNNNGGGGGGSNGFSDGNAEGQIAGGNFDGTRTSGGGGTGGDGGNEGLTPQNGANAGFGGGGGGGGVPDPANTGAEGASGGNGGFGGGGGQGNTGGEGENITQGGHGGGGGDGQFGGGGGSGGNGGANGGLDPGPAGNGGNGGNGGFGAGGGGGGRAGSGHTQGARGLGGSGGFGGGDGSPGSSNMLGGAGLGGAGAGFGGAIFIQRGGNLTIELTSSFTGTLFSGSQVAAGTGNPNAAGNGALGKDVFMMSSSSLTFDLETPASVLNPIQSNIGSEGENQAVGGLTKKGSALLTLAGDHTYTGKTTIEAGELQINGSVISPVEVQEGATLSGNFTAKKMGTNPDSGNITNSGIVSPGVNGVGVIHVEGVYTQTSKGKLVINMTPTGDGSNKILGATSASLDGTLELVLSPGNYVAGTAYLITEAPTNGTTFAKVVTTGELADLIDIKLTYGSALLTILSSHIFEDQNINPGVPQDVADCITTATITPGSDFATMVEVLGTLSDSQVNKALTSLSAVNFGTLEWINARNNSYAADLLSHHLFELCRHQKNCGSHIWTTAFGNLMQNKKQIDNLPRFDANASGMLFGIDFSSQPYFSYGAAFGYTHTDFLWKKKGGKGDIRSYYGALYSGWTYACLSGDLSLLVGSSDNSTKRDISFAAVNRTAKGDFWSHFLTTHVDFKVDLNLCGNVLEPFFLADYHYYTHRNFTETGADSLNLTVQSKDQHMMRGEAGFKWYHEVDCKRYSFAPYLGLSLVEEFPLGKSKQPARFKNQPCIIDALCYDSSAQFGATQAGIQWCHCNGASLLLGYKGLYSDKALIHEIGGRFEWSF